MAMASTSLFWEQHISFNSITSSNFTCAKPDRVHYGAGFVMG